MFSAIFREIFNCILLNSLTNKAIYIENECRHIVPLNKNRLPAIAGKNFTFEAGDNVTGFILKGT